MKKTIIAVVIVLLICVLGLPPLLGMRTESIVRENLQLQTNPLVVTEIEDYERGWFSSTARIGIGLTDEYVEQMQGLMQLQGAGAGAVPAQMLTQRLYFELDLHHGPVVMTDGLYFGLTKLNAGLDEQQQWVQQVQDTLDIPHIIEYRGQINYFGGFTYDADVPPIDYATPLFQVAFSGATFEGRMSRDDSDHEGLIDSIEASVLGMTSIRLDTLTVTATDIHKISQYMSTGDYEMRIESFNVANTQTGEQAVAVNGLHMLGTTSADVDAGTASSTVTYGADTFMIENELDLTDVNVTMTLDNLSLEALDTYYNTILGSAGGATDPEALMQSLQGMIPQLLSTNPSLSIDPISFRFNGEPFDGNIRVAIDNSNPDLASAIGLNPMLALQLLEAEANLRASKPLATEIATLIMMQQMQAMMAGQEPPPGQDLETMAAQQAPAIIGQLVTQGLIVEEEDAYTANISFAGGQVLVNGAPMQIPL